MCNHYRLCAVRYALYVYVWRHLVVQVQHEPGIGSSTQTLTLNQASYQVKSVVKFSNQSCMQTTEESLHGKEGLFIGPAVSFGVN